MGSMTPKPPAPFMRRKPTNNGICTGCGASNEPGIERCPYCGRWFAGDSTGRNTPRRTTGITGD